MNKIIEEVWNAAQLSQIAYGITGIIEKHEEKKCIFCGKPRGHTCILEPDIELTDKFIRIGPSGNKVNIPLKVDLK